MSDLLIGAGGGGGGKGGGGGESYTPSTARDGLDSVQYAQLIDLISEGEIQGLKDGLKSIFINNTPLQNADNSYNFQNVSVYTTTGTQNQASIPISKNIENEISVGTQVLNGLPVIKSITSPNVDAARITITVPQLQAFTDKGDIVGASVDLQIAVQYAGGGFQTVIEDVISGRSGDLYQKDYIVNFTGSKPVDIRVTRVTADSADPKLSNAISFSSLTEITYARLRYPNSALVGLRIDAEQFSSIPSRSYLVRGIKIKIPSNATVDATTGRLIYSGIWNGTFGAAAWCTCPSWILYDFLTSTRYGFGDHIQPESLDKWSFYSASIYANQLVANGFGGQEARFACNVNIQTQEEAFKVVNDLCSVFRAQSYWSTGTLTVSQDKPADSAYLFTLANTLEGGFSYQNSSKKTRPTVALVSYLDLTTREIAIEAVEDSEAISKYGVITTQVSAFACTSRGQASRIGKWLLYEENNSEIVSFVASIEAGVICRPGQVIEIADPMRAGSRRGGRIISATTTVVTVDDATGLSTANSPTLSVILGDGTVQVRPVAGITGNVITVSPAFGSAPNPNSIWIFESTDLQTSTWRVLGVSEQDQCQYAVTAISYNASKYAYIEDGAPLQVRDVSTLNDIPAAPTNLAFTEALYTYQSQVRAKVIAGWKPVLGVNQYEVRWRKDSGNWTIIRQPSVDFEILDITPGLFEFTVYSLNAAGKPSSTALEGSVTALGKTAPPSDVETFTATLDPSVGVTLSWGAVTDLDLQGYEIWQGSGFGSGSQIGVFSATSKKLGLVGLGTTTWWIKALDTSNSFSVNALSTSVTIAAAGAATTSGAFSNDSLILNWTAVAGSLSTAYYEVRYGSVTDTWATSAGRVVGTVQGTTLSIKGAWVGTRRFFVAAVDLKGNVGAAATYDAVVIAPSQPTITQQVIDNNVLLQWTDSTQTLPITSYEVRKGSTYAGSTLIGLKQGRFTTVFESSSATYKYWLTGIDSGGNYGTPGSISAQVNQPPDYVLKLNVDSTFTGTKTNLTALDVGLLASVNTTETWQQHFTSRSWTTLQDQINAGYAYFAMPSPTTAQYYEDVNYGTVLAGTKVATTLTSNVIAGSTTITPTISVKKLIGDPWIVYAGVSSVFATDFQYVRAQYDFASTGGDDLLQITALNVRLDSKLRNDSGNGTANSSDSGGTVVTFNIAFVDVDSISVTPLATSSVTAVYDFVDVPYPTSFKVLLFNSSGARVSGAFSWSARGV
jgi:predicted phage tail protein